MSETATLDLADGVYDADTDWRGMVQETLKGITAGNFPVKPPSDWFSDPGLPQLSPLTIDQNGRVFGHIAAWHTSHIGMAGGIKPPRSKSQYAFFRTGSLETDSGEFVDVGQITLAGGHASLEASVPQAVAHYDDTNSAVMDVAAGEDKHGIWVAGALRPNVDDTQLRTLRASSVSGDWRPINGKLELVAVCAVNCPGFPIPRARVASGTPIALVAAGIEPLIELSIQRHAQQDVEEGIEAGLNILRTRVNHLESVLLAGGPLATDEADVLRARVHGEPESAETIDVEPEAIEAASKTKSKFTVSHSIGGGVKGARKPAKKVGTGVSSSGDGDGETEDAEVDTDVGPTVDELRTRVHGVEAAVAIPKGSNAGHGFKVGLGAKTVYKNRSAKPSGKKGFDADGSEASGENTEVDTDVAPTVDELRARVHGMEAGAVKFQKMKKKRAVTSDGSDTTWDDGLDISVPIAAALRSRVHGNT